MVLIGVFRTHVVSGFWFFEGVNGVLTEYKFSNRYLACRVLNKTSGCCGHYPGGLKRRLDDFEILTRATMQGRGYDRIIKRKRTTGGSCGPSENRSVC